MPGRVEILSPGPAWDQALERLAAHGQEDVYFDHRYLAPYLAQGDLGEAFTYQDGDDLFFLPYLRRPLPAATGYGSLYDFESAYGYGGPLASRRDPGFLEAAWRAFQEHGRSSGLVAGLLRFHNLLANHELVAGELVEVVLDRQTVVLPLNQTPEEVWRAYPSDNRNKINKALRAGVTVAQEEGREALLAMASHYRRRMAELTAGQLYHFSDEYFLALAGLGPKTCRVYLARLEGLPIGGVMVLLSRRFAHYHLSASPREYASYAANNLMRCQITRDLLGAGPGWLNFGGGRTSDPGDALLAFKAKFSRHRRLYCFGRCVLNQELYGQLRARWVSQHPELVPVYGNRMLCYRY